MADVDEEDYVYFGTPIEREEETSSRKRKAIAEAGTVRALAPWKQEVSFHLFSNSVSEFVVGWYL